jgi:hypothetical protein
MRAHREAPAESTVAPASRRVAAPAVAALQRVVGNRGMQRLARTGRVAVARQGQPWNVPIDPNTCSLTFTPDGPRWYRPDGISCDPGVLGIPTPPGSDPFQYNFPWDNQPQAPTLPPGLQRPRDCPPERWVPPSASNGFIGHCRQPDPTPMPDVPPAPPPEYNDLPDLPSDGTRYA